MALVIDAKDMLLGRLSSYVAKQVLLGHTVEIINCEEAVVSGKKPNILANYLRRLDRKAPNKGPYIYKRPDFFVKRTIRGMLPFKRDRGQNAYKLIKCHIGHPASLKSEKIANLEKWSSVSRLSIDHVKVKEICRAMGGRV